MMALSCLYLVVNLSFGNDDLVMSVPGSEPEYGP